MNLQESIRRILREETELPLYIRRRVSLEELDDLVLDVKSLIDSDYDKIDAIYDTVRQFVANIKSFKFNNETERQYWDSYIEIEKPLINYVKKKLRMMDGVNESIRRILREESKIPLHIKRRLNDINRVVDAVLQHIHPCDYDSSDHFVEGVLDEVIYFLGEIKNLNGIDLIEINDYIIEFMDDKLRDFFNEKCTDQ